jgi:hypothetical protein
VVTLDAAKSCTATFSGGPSSTTADLSVTINGSGTVTPSPAGTSCGTNCSTHEIGTVVTLTATTTQLGVTFTNWGGACSGTGTTTTVTMDAAKSCIAIFSDSPVGPDSDVANCFNQQSGIFAGGVCLSASNLQPGAVDSSGTPVDVTVSMKGGISKNSGPYLKESTVILADPIATRAVIQVDPADVGKKIDLIVAGIHYSETMYPQRGFEWYMLEGCETCVKVWPYSDRDAAPLLSELSALKTVDALPSIYVVDMYSGNFVFPGFLDIHYGYRVLGSGKIVFNADPIKVTINP